MNTSNNNKCIKHTLSFLEMSSRVRGDQETIWEPLFLEETLAHIRKSIAAMEEEIYGEFRLILGHEVTISNYWRLKFILSRSMSERERFRDYVNLMVNTFKEDVEKVLNHMKNLMQLSEPPFSRANKDDNDVSTNKDLEDEAESSRRF